MAKQIVHGTLANCKCNYGNQSKKQEKPNSKSVRTQGTTT